MISICIPTYNQTIYLEKLMQSIVEQDYQDFEVVVSDDSTTVDVSNLIENFKEKLPGKIRYYRNSPPLGSPENWNYAISMAKCDIIKIMHHDDYFSTTTSLSRIVQEFNDKKDLTVCFCGGYTNIRGNIRNHTAALKVAKEYFREPHRLFFENVLGSPSSLCVKKQILQFDKNLKWLVDVQAYYKILKRNYEVAYIPEPLIVGVLDDHSLTNSLSDNAEVELTEVRTILKNIDLLNVTDKLAVYKLYLQKLRKYGIYNTVGFKLKCPNIPIDYFINISILFMKLNFKIFKR